MLRPVSAKTQCVVLVCSKCSKKLGGGFGKKGNKSLAKELRKQTGAKKGRKSDLLVIETGCLKLCPKGGVVVVNATQPDKWAIIPARSDVEEIAEAIGVPDRSRG